MADKAPWEKPEKEAAPWEAPADSTTPSLPPEPTAPPTSESLQYAKQFVQGAGNFLGGVGASVFQPIATVQKALTGNVNPTLQELSTAPPGTLGTVGKYAGEAAQFLAPGALEEKAAAKIGEGLANAPKLVRGAAELLPQGVSAAAVNTLQGGSPEAGFEAGMAGGVLGKVGERVAPSLAEGALGLTSRSRGFGKTPGSAILNETRGVRPSVVEESAKQSLDVIGSQIEQEYRAAGQAGKTVSIQPALDFIQGEWEKAVKGRNPELQAQLENLYNRLATDISGQQGAINMSPEDLWHIKRNIGDMNWNPNIKPHILQRINRGVYGAFDKELDRVAPKAADLNQRYSSVKEVAHRADITARGAELPQRGIDRLRAHTGALTGMIAGAGYGGYEGGVPGAIKYGALGLVGPEIIGGPTSAMIMARTAPKAFRAAPKIALPLVRELQNQ